MLPMTVEPKNLGGKEELACLNYGLKQLAKKEEEEEFSRKMWRCMWIFIAGLTTGQVIEYFIDFKPAALYLYKTYLGI